MEIDSLRLRVFFCIRGCTGVPPVDWSVTESRAPKFTPKSCKHSHRLSVNNPSYSIFLTLSQIGTLLTLCVFLTHRGFFTLGMVIPNSAQAACACVHQKQYSPMSELWELSQALLAEVHLRKLRGCRLGIHGGLAAGLHRFVVGQCRGKVERYRADCQVVTTILDGCVQHLREQVAG
jgi:hypothetical protein